MKKSELPGTLKRSPEKAQRTFEKVHDSAAREYGDGERAHRTAYAAVKHSFEKVDDHWEPKERKGPSDPGAERRGAETFGGVDYNGHTKSELMDRARRLDIEGRSRMNKKELARAIARRQD